MSSTITMNSQVKAGAVEHLSSKSISDEDLQRMVDLSVLAFENARKEDGDTSHDFVFDDDVAIPPLWFRQLIRAGMIEEAVYVVRGQDGDIIGLGLFLKPGQKAASTEEIKHEIGHYEFLEKVKPETRRWYEDNLHGLLQGREALFTDEERGKRWWCFHLCTDPRFHGKGLGRKIVDYIHGEAQKNGQFLGLAASNEVNVGKYKALGFRLRGRITAPGLHSENGDKGNEQPHVLYILTRDT
ncbi:hypothetical protein BDP27DRAFT_1329404 [Rhodocollybia butyracea]|uniref:N-acetyltransferase domain-containing protein n=1 Tax=Rhodocollybia butyracea TaxID=206335 RepID=A0A9P5PPR4_9AGAR|nr:hypothetical protein BDP27DRAFT_1329404 [Rhodocollybia butyracea]